MIWVMNHVRRAGAADALELVRLRGVLLGSMIGHETPDDGWQESSASIFSKRLVEPDPTMAAFVVDRPGAPGMLAACAVGTIEERLGIPGNPSGLVGYVFNVATDPEQRRLGYSRACVTALLDWYRERGIRTIDLRATAEGEPLYRSLGFSHTADPAMRLKF
jgi:GNAT superfamily N-acetyltransferase